MRRMAKNLKKGMVIAPATSAFDWTVMWTETVTRPMGDVVAHCEALGFRGVSENFHFLPDQWVKLRSY